jgi:hypothetical protein
VSELYPAKLKYNSKFDKLYIELDYVTRVEKLDENNIAYLGYYNPSDQGEKNVKKREHLEKRKRKLPDDEFISMFFPYSIF